MEADERSYLLSMPLAIPAWRGFFLGRHHDEADALNFARGRSWTTERDVALEYARVASTTCRDGWLQSYVAQTAIPRDLVFAHFHRNSRRELIVLDPDQLGAIDIEQVSYAGTDAPDPIESYDAVRIRLAAEVSSDDPTGVSP